MPPTTRTLSNSQSSQSAQSSRTTSISKKPALQPSKTTPPAPTKDGRKADVVDESIQNYIQSMLNDFVAQLDHKIDNLLKEKFDAFANGIHDKIAGVEKNMAARIDFLEGRVSTLETRLSEANKMNNNRILDDANHADRSKNFLIHGVPNDPNLDVKQLVKNICSKYETSFDNEWAHCFRIKSAKDDSTTTPIMCKFVSREKRDSVFHKYIAKRDLKLSDVMDCAGVDLRVYINEHLSKEEAAIIRECRQLKKDKRIFRFYQRDGRIMVATSNEKNNAKRVSSLDDLTKLIGVAAAKEKADGT